MTPPYEVRCYSCNVSFPPETKRCTHCGNPTGPAPLLAETADSFSFGNSAPTETSAQAQPRGESIAEEEREAPPSGIMRFGRVAIWAILAIGAVVSRACNDGG